MGGFNPSIILGGIQPQPQSPLANIAQLMQIRNSGAEYALRQAQMADVAAQAQQRNRDLTDNNLVQQAMRDPDKRARILNGDTSDLAGMIQPKTDQGLQTWAQGLKEKAATLTTTQLTNRKTATDQAIASLAGLRGLKAPDGSTDFDAINQQLPGTLSRLAPVMQIAGMQVPSLTRITNDSQLDQFEQQLGIHQAVINSVLAQKKTGAEAGEAESKGSEAAAAAEHQQLLNSMLKAAANGNPGMGEAAIHAMFNPPGSQASIDPTGENGFITNYRAARGAANPVEEQQKVLTAATQHVAGIGTATSPAVRAGKASEAAAVAGATLPFDIRKAGGEAFARMPAEMQMKASETLQSAQADYGQSVASANAIKQAISMATNGNQVAASQVPGLTAALQLAMFDIKRLPANVAENMGSVQDKIANAYDSLVHNRPVNWGELNQLPAYIDTITGAAANRYNAVADSVEQAYHVKGIPRVTAPAAPPPAPNAKAAVGGYQIGHLYGGKKYLGGDPNQASNWQ